MSPLAVIFDMDGVLVDSYHAHYESWKLAFAEVGREFSEETFAAGFGRTSHEILRETLGNDADEARIDHVDAQKEALYREILRENFTAVDGAADLVQALAKDGFRLAIGSSGPPENVALVLEQLGDTAQCFNAIVTRRDVTRGKPDPQVFLIAAERLGVAPHCCAVIEDAVHGITAAQRAGMAAIALTGTATRDELAAADAVVDNLRQLSPERIRALICGRRQ